MGEAMAAAAAAVTMAVATDIRTGMAVVAVDIGVAAAMEIGMVGTDMETAMVEAEDIVVKSNCQIQYADAC